MLEITSAMIIWGTLGVFVLWAKLPMVDIALIRCLFGAVFLGLYCLYKPDIKLSLISIKEVCLVVISGLFLVLNWYLLFKSFQLASITIGNVSYYLQPVFLVIFGALIFKEHISYKSWIFILLSFIGVLLTMGIKDFGVAGNFNMMLGSLYAVSAGVLYSFVTILTRQIKTMTPSIITLIQLVSGAIIIIPWFQYSALKSLTLVSGLYLIIIGVIHTAVAYIIYYKGIKKVTLVNIAVLSYIDPIVAVFSDILFFHRELSQLQFLGIIITLTFTFKIIQHRKRA